jgi:hypothetical protein
MPASVSAVSHHPGIFSKSQATQLSESALSHDTEGNGRESIITSASAASHEAGTSGGARGLIISVQSAASVELQAIASSEPIASPDIGTLQTESITAHEPSDLAIGVRLSSDAVTADLFVSAEFLSTSELISEVVGQPEELVHSKPAASSDRGEKSSASVREATSETPPPEL